jgi:hypothetical protein
MCSAVLRLQLRYDDLERSLVRLNEQTLALYVGDACYPGQGFRGFPQFPRANSSLPPQSDLACFQTFCSSLFNSQLTN